MNGILKISWLVPVIPFLGSSLVIILLISFKRTMNRLTKPVTFFLSICILLSTLLSIFLFINNVVVNHYDWYLDFAIIDFNLSLTLSSFIEKILIIIGLISLSIQSLYFFLSKRPQGYVLNLSIITAMTGILLFTIMDGILPLPLS